MLVSLLAGVVAAADGNDLRTWTSSDGKYQTEARLVEVKDDAVVLEKADGSQVTVPLARLSATDRKFATDRNNVTEQAETKNKPQATPEQPYEKYVQDFARFLEKEPVVELELVRTFGKRPNARLPLPYTRLAFSQDGRRLISCLQAGESQVWEVETGELISKYRPSNEITLSVALSPDGKYGVIGAGQSVHVFDADTGEMKFVHEAPEDSVRYVDVSRDGKWMAAISTDSVVHRFPLLGGIGTSRPFENPGNKITSFALAPDGGYAVVTNLGQPSVVVSFAKNPAVSTYFTFSSMQRPLSIAISDKRILIGSNDLQFQLLNAFKKRAEALGVLEVRTAMSRTRAQNRLMYLAALSPDSRYGLLADHSGYLEITETDLPSTLSRYKFDVGKVNTAAIGPDAQTIAYGNREGSISIWKLSGFPENRQVELQRALHEWLSEKDFARLDALARWVQETPNSVPGSAPAFRFATLTQYVISPPLGTPDFFERLEAWHQDARKSQLASVCLAEAYIDAAWEARGAGFANTVTEEGFRVFAERMGQAHDLLKPMIDAGGAPAKAYELLFRVATAQSWERETTTKYAEKLLKEWPEYYPAHAEIAVKRLPRWGGAAGDSAEYAKLVDSKIGGDKGAAVYAGIANWVRNYFPESQFLPATGFDYERIRDGYLGRVNAEPSDVEAILYGMLFAKIASDRETGLLLQEKLTPYLDTWWLRDWGANYQEIETVAAWGRELLNDWPTEKPITPLPENAVTFSKVADADPEATGLEWKNYDSITGRQSANGPIISPLGKLAVMHREEVLMFDLISGKLLQRISPAGRTQGVAFSEDDKVAAAFTGSQIELWAVEPGQRIAQLGSRGTLADVALRDRQLIAATTGSVTTISLVEKGKKPIEHFFRINTLVVPGEMLSQNGKLIAIPGSQDKARLVRILDTVSGEEVAVVSPAYYMGFQPGGESVLVRSPDEGLKRVELESGDAQLVVPEEKEPVRSAAIDATGKFVVTGDSKGTVRLFEVESGKQLAELKAHNRLVTSVGFLTKDKGIFSVAGEELKLWAAVPVEK